MDIATLFGILLGLLVFAEVWVGPLTGQPNSAAWLVVVGGGFAAGLVALRAADVVAVPSILLRVIHNRTPNVTQLIRSLVGQAETRAAEGILAWEDAARRSPFPDPFLMTGVRLATDGTEPELIHSILMADHVAANERAQSRQHIMGVLGWSWGLFGVVGALTAIATAPAGHSPIAEAGAPLTVGLLLAIVFGVSVRYKLKILGEDDALVRRLMLEAVMSIQSNDNPRMVEQKLNVMVSPAQRAVSPPSDEEPAPPSPAVDGVLVDNVREALVELRRALPDSLDLAEETPTVDDLLAQVPEESQGTIVEALGEQPTQPVQSIRLFAHGFAELGFLSDKHIQLVLMHVDVHDLSRALLGAAQSVRDRFLDNVSDRVRGMILVEMSGLGTPPARHVLNAQVKMLHIVQRLAAVGTIAAPGASTEGNS